jgi:hypothetical protein
MAILGYSEGGIFTSIVYYLDAHKDKTLGFLEKIGIRLDPGFQDFTFLIEQSFSSFGEPDLTVIAKKGAEKAVIFIEGKTVTNGSSNYTVEAEFQKLKDAISNYSNNKDDSRKKTGSNLFTQLYYKYELVKFLKDDTSADNMSPIFKRDGGMSRKTGERGVVLRACEKIKDAHRYYYAAILPEKERITSKEFAKYFSELGDPGIDRFFSANKDSIVCGFWDDIENYFTGIKAETVKENFKHNEGQIYRKP